MNAFLFGLVIQALKVAATKKFATISYLGIVTFGFVQGLVWTPGIALATIDRMLVFSEVKTQRLLTKPNTATLLATNSTVQPKPATSGHMTPLKGDLLDILKTRPRGC